VPKLPGSVAVVASSAADLPQVEECRLLAEYLGCYAFKLCNLDMTDMQKLMDSAEAIKAADVVVVVSSGDSALPAAVASVVDAPIVALPASQQGEASGLAPSEAFMASCTPGVTAVGPDNGYAAAVTAARTLRMASRLHHMRTMAAAAAGGGAH
jgi:NCAIR mutase (PurE)-related protein